MTAEERMRERAAKLADERGAWWTADAILDLPLEGEQGDPVAWRWRQRGPSETDWQEWHVVGHKPKGPASPFFMFEPLYAAPHHHSRTEQASPSVASTVDAKPAPAREPAVEEAIQVSLALDDWSKKSSDLLIVHAKEIIDHLIAENAALREKLQGGVVVPREPTE